PDRSTARFVVPPPSLIEQTLSSALCLCGGEPAGLAEPEDLLGDDVPGLGRRDDRLDVAPAICGSWSPMASSSGRGRSRERYAASPTPSPRWVSPSTRR